MSGEDPASVMGGPLSKPASAMGAGSHVPAELQISLASQLPQLWLQFGSRPHSRPAQLAMQPSATHRPLAEQLSPFPQPGAQLPPQPSGPQTRSVHIDVQWPASGRFASMTPASSGLRELSTNDSPASVSEPPSPQAAVTSKKQIHNVLFFGLIARIALSLCLK